MEKQSPKKDFRDNMLFFIAIIAMFIVGGHNGLLSGFGEGCLLPHSGKNSERIAKMLDPLDEPTYVETPPRLEFYEQ